MSQLNLKLEFVLIPNFLIFTFDWPKVAKALSLLQGTYLRYRWQTFASCMRNSACFADWFGVKVIHWTIEVAGRESKCLMHWQVGSLGKWGKRKFRSDYQIQKALVVCKRCLHSFWDLIDEKFSPNGFSEAWFFCYFFDLCWVNRSIKQKSK